jgi:bacillithiol system protein YtxJ
MIQLPYDWKELTSETEFNEALQHSHSIPVVIFKHSTRCGISAHKWHDLESDWNLPAGKVALYYLDLLAHRELSNAIAKQTGVMHQSPQLILLKDGKATAHASHAYATFDFLIKHL